MKNAETTATAAPDTKNDMPEIGAGLLSLLADDEPVLLDEPEDDDFVETPARSQQKKSPHSI